MPVGICEPLIRCVKKGLGEHLSWGFKLKPATQPTGRVWMIFTSAMRTMHRCHSLHVTQWNSVFRDGPNAGGSHKKRKNFHFQFLMMLEFLPSSVARGSCFLDRGDWKSRYSKGSYHFSDILALFWRNINVEHIRSSCIMFKTRNYTPFSVWWVNRKF